jgi:hypothetical protein
MIIGALLEWMSARWRKATPIAERRRPAASLQPPKPVPAKYQSLCTYLEHRYASNVVLTFEQIEALLGAALPEPAYTERDWWTGGTAPLQPHSAAWTGAGRTATPNLSARTVTFERLP